MNRITLGVSFLIVLLVVAMAAIAVQPVYGQETEPPPTPTEGESGEGEVSQVGKVIGVLGLYAAMMAVLATGTEVIVDIIRPLAGLKRKSTTTEALTKLKEWLPNTLEELGVGSEIQQQVNQQIQALEAITGKFDENIEGQIKSFQEQLLKNLQDKGSEAALAVLNVQWPVLDKTLADPPLNVLEPQRLLMRHWLEASLKNPYESISAALTMIETQRKQLEGILSPVFKVLDGLWKIIKRLSEKWFTDAQNKVEDKFWKGVAHILLAPFWLEWAILWLFDRLPGGAEFVKWREGWQDTEKQLKHSFREVFAQLLDEENAQQNHENRRINWLRIMSVVVGIALAWTLHIDSLQLISPIIPEMAMPFHDEAGNWYAIRELTAQRGTTETLVATPAVQTTPGFFERVKIFCLNLTPGIVLSGLAAAAGSAFWHDQLDKLRNAKEAAVSMEQLVKQLKESTVSV